jgi:hypothetical protein
MRAATLGFSNEAKHVANATRKGYQHLQSSNAIGIEPVREELGTVWEECRTPNWDGYGAAAVSQDSLRNTYLLLESLPLASPRPSIGAEPDGELTLEWHHSPRRTLSVSVSPAGELHFAALLGPNRVYGTEAFFGEVPERILELIKQVFLA